MTKTNFTFYVIMTNEIPRFKLTNDNSSYIQSFPVYFTGSETDFRPPSVREIAFHIRCLSDL
jgi:hypothetical protein